MSRGFTVTEFAAATFIGLPLLIIGIQIMPGLMKVSAKSTEAGISTMLLRNTWDSMRSEIRTDSGFDVNYSQSAVAFDAPYNTYKLTVVDSSTDDMKQLTLTVWYDRNNNGSYGTGEMGYSISGYLGRHAW